MNLSIPPSSPVAVINGSLQAPVGGCLEHGLFIRFPVQELKRFAIRIGQFRVAYATGNCPRRYENREAV